MGDRGEVPVVVDSLGDDLVLRETATIHIREDDEASTEALQLEEMIVDVPVHPEGKTAFVGSLDDGLVLQRREEASSSRAAMDVSSPTDVRGKTVTEEATSQVRTLIWTI